MNIKNNWKIDDAATGLSIKVVPGESLDKLQIRGTGNGLVRDFWFTKDGTFDGTGAFYDDGSEGFEDAADAFDNVGEEIVNGKEI